MDTIRQSACLIVNSNHSFIAMIMVSSKLHDDGSGLRRNDNPYIKLSYLVGA